MKKIRRLAVPLLAVLCSMKICAQSVHSRVMGLQELFELAEENSRRVQVYHTAHEAADAAVGSARAARLPEVGVSLSVSYLGDGWLADRDFRHGMNIDMPHFGNNFAVAASQVLYAGGAISSGIELAELGKQMAALDVQKNRQDVRFLLVGHYLDLYKLSNQEQVLEQNIRLTLAVIRNMEARLGQGAALRNDITRYELQWESQKLQLARVRDARRILNHQIVTTLQLPLETEIVPDTILLAGEVPVQAEQDWWQLAVSGNAALRQADLACEISRQELKQTRAGSLPKVAIVAEEHFDGPITIEVPVLDNNFNYWFVGLGVKYDLSSVYKNNRNIRRAKLNTRRAEEQKALAIEQVGNAVQAQYVNFLTSFTELRTQEKSVELALQNYEVTNRRYEQELALLTDMLDAGNMKLQAELNLVNARIGVLYNYYKLRYIAHSL